LNQQSPHKAGSAGALGESKAKPSERRVPTAGEVLLVWQLRGKLCAALSALEGLDPDYPAVCGLLDGAIEAAHALAWLEGAS
jgi:hypothetical protein